MKIFTRTLFAAMAFMACFAGAGAQTVDNTFRFVDKNGNEIPDGGTYTAVAELIDKLPEMPGLVVSLEAPFGLDVENTTADVAYVSAVFTTNNMSSGSLTVCFPNGCVEKVPAIFETSNDFIVGGGKKALQSEWLPEKGKYGGASFTIQLRTMDAILNDKGLPVGYSFKANGPKITINCIYADPTGIDDVNATGLTTYNVYDMSGLKVVDNGTEAEVQALDKGLYIHETVIDGKRVAVKKVVR